MVRQCCVRRCRNSAARGCPWSFHQLPREPDLRMKWIRSIGEDVTSNHAVVCSVHFKTEDFFPIPFSGKAQLRGNAVPSIFGYRTDDVQRKVMPICCVRGCSHEQVKGSPWSFHRLPVKPDLHMKWIAALGGDVSNRAVVCSAHFRKEDLCPVYASGIVKLREGSIPSVFTYRADDVQPRKFQTVTVEEDENLSVIPAEADAISKTKLPDGSVCAFFSTSVAEEESTSEDTEDESVPTSIKREAESPIEYVSQGSTCLRKRKASDDPLARLDGLKIAKTSANDDPEEPQKDGASTDNAGMDFETIASALEQDGITLPSSSWSSTRLGDSIIMFLCWDKDLTLIKKAVLREGSRMALYLGDYLLADGSTLDLLFNLEGCLRLLDMFEQCKGHNGKNNTWSQNCEKYTFITDGNQICNACRQDMASSDVNHVNTSVTRPLVTAMSHVGTGVPVLAVPQYVSIPSPKLPFLIPDPVGSNIFRVSIPKVPIPRLSVPNVSDPLLAHRSSALPSESTNDSEKHTASEQEGTSANIPPVKDKIPIPKKKNISIPFLKPSYLIPGPVGSNILRDSIPKVPILRLPVPNVSDPLLALHSSALSSDSTNDPEKHTASEQEGTTATVSPVKDKIPISKKKNTSVPFLKPPYLIPGPVGSNILRDSISRVPVHKVPIPRLPVPNVSDPLMAHRSSALSSDSTNNPEKLTASEQEETTANVLPVKDKIPISTKRKKINRLENAGTTQKREEISENVHSETQHRPEFQGVASEPDSATAGLSFCPDQSGRIDSQEVGANPGFLVVDFVVSNDGSVIPSIQASVFKKPVTTSASEVPQSQQITLTDDIRERGTRKPTARKSTGGPRSCQTRIEKDLPIDPEPIAIKSNDSDDEVEPNDPEPCRIEPYDPEPDRSEPYDPELDRSELYYPEPDVEPLLELDVPVVDEVKMDINEVKLCSESIPADLPKTNARSQPVIFGSNGLENEYLS